MYPIATRIDNCNFNSRTVWEGDIGTGGACKYDRKRAPGRQFIAEAGDLRFLDDASYEFLLSSYCIEHMANPLKGLAEWIRVLMKDGLLTLVIPHKDGTFDHRRPPTLLGI